VKHIFHAILYCTFASITWAEDSFFGSIEAQARLSLEAKLENSEAGELLLNEVQSNRILRHQGYYNLSTVSFIVPSSERVVEKRFSEINDLSERKREEIRVKVSELSQGISKNERTNDDIYKVYSYKGYYIYLSESSEPKLSERNIELFFPVTHNQ